MKYINLILLSFLLWSTSCEKVIDIELNDATPQVVIEAVILEGEHDFTVKVSRTAPYFDNTPSEKIENAVITLKYDDQIQDIPHIGEGEYQFPLDAKVDTEFALEVDVDGTVYTASTTLIEKIAIDSIYYEYEEGFGPREAGYIVYIKYTDPAAYSNFYRITHSLNGIYQNTSKDLQVFDDSKTNGNQVKVPVRSKTFELGDVVHLQLIHFDEPSYDYFNSLDDIISSGGGPRGGSAAPGNPLSNWSNNALGYFSAYSSDTANITITE
ncbi:DUF4249 domain-containing protein [Flammeovirga agarivorans]|uniref:DUF4249 domain-containing protein n=1 Tax=Flammeovirga agarivorans TaxID=2726742 RepID=A0A7X8SQP1_9BACT|nr:DUF4249 domain-containing protein [Flammeovirga agarivorans]NLR94477.1 DUF4249 domain-containing protein [Flammeovirga agarivorans]